MTKNAKTASPAQIAETRAALVGVKDYYPNLSPQEMAAREEWAKYEQFLNLPWVPKTDAAVQGVVFSINRIGEGKTTDLNDIAATVDQWVLMVTFAVDCTLRTREGVVSEFARGENALIALPKGQALRDQTADVISKIIGKYGAMHGYRLKRLEASRQGHSGPIVLEMVP